MEIVLDKNFGTSCIIKIGKKTIKNCDISPVLDVVTPELIQRENGTTEMTIPQESTIKYVRRFSLVILNIT